MTFSDELKDLLNKMLEVNPFKRIKIDEILEHPWLAEINQSTCTMKDV